MFRRIVASLGIAMLAVFVLGCGADDERAAAPATSPVAATMSAEMRERFEKNLPAPEVQTRSIMNSELEPWLKYLRFKWDVKPTAEYTATKVATARWRIGAVIAGNDKDERISATWLLHIPLDRAPTDAEMEGDDPDDSIEAIDAGARHLGELPPAVPGNTAALSGILRIDGKAFAFDADAEQTDESDATRRAMKAIGDPQASDLRLTLDASTRIKNAQGDRLTVASLRRAVEDLERLSPTAFVSWKLDHEVRSAPTSSAPRPAR